MPPPISQSTSESGEDIRNEGSKDVLHHQGSTSPGLPSGGRLKCICLERLDAGLSIDTRSVDYVPIYR
jgi:hypothetical protein